MKADYYESFDGPITVTSVPDPAPPPATNLPPDHAIYTVRYAQAGLFAFPRR